MTTLVSTVMRAAVLDIVALPGLPSAVLSGIAPDPAHLEGGGYHCSVEDLRAYGNQDDYSNVRPDDRNFNVPYGAAFDVSVKPADMVTLHGRIRSVWADRSDPRRQYVNAINCWDGSGDAVRYDFVDNTATWATADHKWHVHGEWRRRFVLAPVACRAMVSIFAGESESAWAGRNGGIEMELSDQLYGGADPNDSWKRRFGSQDDSVKNGLVFAAVYAKDAATNSAALLEEQKKTNALLAQIVAQGKKA